MPHWESMLLLAVGTTLVSLALAVALSGFRSPPHRCFAAFLALVGGNFLADWMSGVYYNPNANSVSDPMVLWRHAASVFFRFDPAALLYFASIYPRRSGPLATTLGLGMLVGTASVLVASTFGDYATLAATSLPVALNVPSVAFMVTCYLGALALAIRNLARAEFSTTRQDLRALVAGLLVVVAPRMGLVGLDLGMFRQADAAEAIAVQAAVTLLVLVIAVLALRRAIGPADWPATRPWIGAAGGFVVLYLALVPGAAILAGPLDPAGGAYDVLLSSLYSGRWVLFAAIVGYAFTRHAFLEWTWRGRAPASATPLLAGLATFLSLRVVLAGIPSAHDGTSVGDALAAMAATLVVVGVLFAPAPGGRNARPADEGLHGRKLDVYRGLLEASLESGAGSEATTLGEHRARLGLSPAEHRSLLVLVESERALRQAQGPEGALPQGLRLLRAFPSGGAGWTVLAAPRDGGPPVVVKLLHPQLRADARAREQFLREGRLLKRVDHPNVVRILDVLETPPALLLQFAEGGSLADRVHTAGPLSPAELERLAGDLLAGLGALHAARIVHRDLKPENVLLAADGRALVADVGVARDLAPGSTRARLTAPGQEPGTVLYMAPEQVRGQPSDARTDLYALGAVLAFAATGRHYLAAEGHGEFEVKRLILEARPALPAALRGSVRSLVVRCLAKQASRRPASADEAMAMFAPRGRP